jgi:hypothetical protein
LTNFRFSYNNSPRKHSYNFLGEESMATKPVDDYKQWFSLYPILTQALPYLGTTQAEASILSFLGTRSLVWKRIWIKSSVREITGNGKYPYEFIPLPLTQPSVWRGLVALRYRETLFTFPEKIYGRCYFKLNWPQMINLIRKNLEISNSPCMPPAPRQRYSNLSKTLEFMERIEQERRTPVDENERLKRQKTYSNGTTYEQKGGEAEEAASGT